jgi:hypothetical protein
MGFYYTTANTRIKRFLAMAARLWPVFLHDEASEAPQNIEIS